MKCINCFESVTTEEPTDIPQIKNELWDRRLAVFTFSVLLDLWDLRKCKHSFFFNMEINLKTETNCSYYLYLIIVYPDVHKFIEANGGGF